MKSSLYNIGDDKSEARGVFNFLADNTNIEWGIVGYSEAGEHYKVGSSYKSDEEALVSAIA